MAITLPGWLVEAIRYLGKEFPQTNEDTLFQWAGQLRSMSGTFDQANASLAAAVSHLQSHNEGPGIDAFVVQANGQDADMATLDRFGEGCEVAAQGCEICAYAVVTLKGVVLFQLALLAPALAAGPVSFLLKRGVEYAIDKAVEVAIAKILEA
ncbi:hypothetical protein ACQB6R_09565 [Propionibacteriaceae bacterium G1746]|uniref:WXG100-like domain-containing protein n=1 Tax=Aestuariimicrobium sp. G57 TaxID=3418485 RepID=UPI003C1A795E